MNAVDPEVDVVFSGEIPLGPVFVFRFPDPLQANDIVGGEAGGVRAED